jgi:hypothetical protein
MARRGSHHARVGALTPRRTAFDLSYEKKFTCDFAQLIPVMCDEVVPGDYFRIGTQTVIRTQPMFAPLLHEVNITCHYYFVPYRLLMKDWENFITGGPDGNYVSAIPYYPDGHGLGPDGNPFNIPASAQFGKGSLWDYFGFPLTSDSGGHFNPSDTDNRPCAFPYRAYNFIWNEYYRDENHQAPSGFLRWDSYTPEDDADKDPHDPFYFDFIPNSMADQNGKPYLRNWTKDYFTSALPFQQRGQAPAFPITGTLPVQFGVGLQPNTVGNVITSGFPIANAISNPPNGISLIPSSVGTQNVQVGPAQIDLGQGVSFNVNDLRRIVQLQKWMERNARGGIRYTEFLRAHFNVTPTDERLNRPEYIGGSKSNLIVSEVLQTSANAGNAVGTQSETPQGNMSGHGIMAANGSIGGYFVKEYGLIMGIMSIMPTPSYEDGIDRQWKRKVNTDFYFPEFVNLSEQGIENGEIYSDGTNTDNTVWGFQPQYDEMRIKRNMVCADMRVNTSNNISFWHLGRSFNALPTLGSDFVRCNPVEFNRSFAVDDFPHFIVSHANIIKAVRPLPYIGEPGLVDHH